MAVSLLQQGLNIEILFLLVRVIFSSILVKNPNQSRPEKLLFLSIKHLHILPALECLANTSDGV